MLACARSLLRSSLSWGGSADAWRYDKWMQCSQRELYDANARRLAEVFSACGVRATTGAEELLGLEIADGYGHVSHNSKHVVCSAYVSWVAQRLRSEVEQEFLELHRELGQ